MPSDSQDGSQKTFSLAVAPMMEWTDTHCRNLHRHYSPNAELYTEMVTTGALLHGPRERLLRFTAAEHPLVLQLGGCDPDALARCAELAAHTGFREVNLNVGCPSDRVQQGRIGACLMAEPELVRDCCAAMHRASGLPVSVKCRLGIDALDSDEFLFRFVETVLAGGVTQFILHARIALLQGLSPSQNRSVPPLNYGRVARLRARLPELRLILNGGLDSVDGALTALSESGCDGVMIGRAAYQNPWLLAELDQAFYATPLPASRLTPIEDYLPYIAARLAEGERLHRVTRHIHGIASGLPGARRFRRHLSEYANRDGADLSTVQEALAALAPARAA